MGDHIDLSGRNGHFMQDSTKATYCWSYLLGGKHVPLLSLEEIVDTSTLIEESMVELFSIS